jgi:signal transduction histidine kinase
LFAAVDERFLRDRPLADYEVAVASAADMAVLVDDILRLFPDTSNVFMVMGSGPLGKFWHQELERDFQRFRGRVSFIWSDELSYTEILRRVATLPPRSAIYFLTFGTDGRGGIYPEGRVLQEISATANAPLFGPLSAQMGYGVVGGTLMDGHEMAKNTADAAVRILNGESPAHIRIPAQEPGPPVFDWRELQRWNVDESRLPPGSIVQFREPTAWQRFRSTIIAGVLAIIGQAGLIGALLIHRAKRRRAEQSLRNNVADLQAARGALSNLSGRLMHAQEQERSRLARELHDDVVQRMSFLAMDVARLRDELPPDAANALGQAQELQEAVLALGRDVQGISHRLHSSKIDVLGLPAAAGGFCKELMNRHDLKVEYTHANVPSELPDGVAISLFRVMQEALSNVVKHSRARRCAVSLRGTDRGLTLEVVDDGRGFDARADSSAQGLGLTSMRERLKLVNGDLVIESKAGSGTTVRATVSLAPRDAPGNQGASLSPNLGFSSTTA